MCQDPVIASAPIDVWACNGHNDPDFQSTGVTAHDHVVVNGRFEWNELRTY